jgi:hypothetical protein
MPHWTEHMAIMPVQAESKGKTAINAVIVSTARGAPGTRFTPILPWWRSYTGMKLTRRSDILDIF